MRSMRAFRPSLRCRSVRVREPERRMGADGRRHTRASGSPTLDPGSATRTTVKKSRVRVSDTNTTNKQAGDYSAAQSRQKVESRDEYRGRPRNAPSRTIQVRTQHTGSPLPLHPASPRHRTRATRVDPGYHRRRLTRPPMVLRWQGPHGRKRKVRWIKFVCTASIGVPGRRCC